MIPTVARILIHLPVMPYSLDTDTVTKLLKDVFFH